MNTPSKTKAKTQVCDDVEKEFYSRIMSTFASFYDIPTAEPMLTFPLPPKKSSEAPPQEEEGKKSKLNVPQQFQSIIWDKRLKKASDKFGDIKNEASEKVEKELPRFDELFNKGKPDIYSIFLPEEANRPPIPKYLVNEENDKKAYLEEIRNRSKPKSINLKDAQAKFEKRLKKQEERKEKKKLFMTKKAEELEKEHMDFLNSLPKAKGPKPTIEDNSKIFAARKKAVKALHDKMKKEGKKINEYNKKVMHERKLAQSTKELKPENNNDNEEFENTDENANPNGFDELPGQNVNTSSASPNENRYKRYKYYDDDSEESA